MRPPMCFFSVLLLGYTIGVPLPPRNDVSNSQPMTNDTSTSAFINYGELIPSVPSVNNTLGNSTGNFQSNATSNDTTRGTFMFIFPVEPVIVEGKLPVTEEPPQGVNLTGGNWTMNRNDQFRTNVPSVNNPLENTTGTEEPPHGMNHSGGNSTISRFYGMDIRTVEPPHGMNDTDGNWTISRMQPLLMDIRYLVPNQAAAPPGPRCVLATCALANLGNKLQSGGDEKAGHATKDAYGPGK